MQVLHNNDEVNAVILSIQNNNLSSNKIFYSGGRSNIYKIEGYCLKLYTPKARKDGESEAKALLALQDCNVPKLYAYKEGSFVLTEWIDGLNLLQYKRRYGKIPSSLIYDMYKSEQLILDKGFKDWDFKLGEHLLWLPSGEFRRIDLGMCKEFSGSLDNLKSEVNKNLFNLYNNNDDKLEVFNQKLYKYGLNKSEVGEAISTFRSTLPKLVY